MTLLPRQSGQFIMEHAEHVHIDDKALENLAHFLATQTDVQEYDITKWKSDNELHPQSMTAESIEWIFVVDSLNFSFWSNSGEKYTIDGYDGYWALCAAINRAIKESIPITDAKFYSELSEKDAIHIFRTDNGVTIPMLKDRIDILHQNGKILLQKFDGYFSNCLKNCNNSAICLLKSICDNFPSFRDESVFHNQKVSFYKRAQILIADIWGCFEGKDLGYFIDIDQLTMFADYRVPQVLHYFDVLQYSTSLTNELKKSQLLTSGCQFEIEIRGASIHAIEMLKTKMQEMFQKESRTVPNSIQIDFYLWGYRRENSKQIDTKSPFHRIRCIFY